ncbi:MAG: hypothetical protein WKG01_08805 [Kofleriaceae bacterium]
MRLSLPVAALAAASLVSCSNDPKPSAALVKPAPEPAIEKGSAEEIVAITQPQPVVKKPLDSRPLPKLAKLGTGKKGAAPSGKSKWAIGFGGLGVDVPRDLAVTAAGEIYVAGLFDGQLDLGAAGKFTAIVAPPNPALPKGELKTGMPAAPPTDAYLIKLGTNGKLAWARTFGAGREDAANGVAVSKDGSRVVVVGNYLDEIKHGTFSKKSAGSDDLFIAAFDKAGEPDFLFTAGGIDSDGANAIVATPDGGWVIGGSFTSAVTFVGTKLVSKGGTDAFLMKLAATGDLEWIKQFGGTYNDTIRYLAVDGQGSLFVQGILRDKADWGGDKPLVAAGNADNDVVLAKYDSNGDHLWSKSFGDKFDDEAGGLSVDPAGNVTMVGSFDHSISFGEGDSHKSKGLSDIFIARFSGTGQLAWAKTYGDKRYDVAVGVGCDAEGNTVVTGWFEGAIDFQGETPIKSTGNKDVFVIKLDPSGAATWVRTFGDKDHDQGRAVEIDDKGGIVLAGLYRFAFDAVQPALESVRADGDRIPKPDTYIVRLER